MRLIDLDLLLGKVAAMQACETRYAFNFLNDAQNPSTEWECVEDMIDSIPIAEVQPVKHGEWMPAVMDAETKEAAEVLGIDIETFLSKTAYCSCCGMQQITNGQDRTRKALIHKAVYRYCPSCGSKMDGGKSDG